MAGLPVELSDEKAVEILFGKYSLLKQEIHLQIAYLKNHVRNFQFIFVPALTAAAYLIAGGSVFKPDENNRAVWLLFGIALVTGTCYLIYDVLDASFQIFMIAERLSTLEIEINTIARRRLLLWESEFSERFNIMKPFPGVWNPLSCVRFYIGILLFGLLIVVPVWESIILWNAGSNSLLFRIAIMLFLAYSVVSICFLFYVGYGVRRRARESARDVLRREIAI